jgi:stringent starvation protein B
MNKPNLPFDPPVPDSGLARVVHRQWVHAYVAVAVDASCQVPQEYVKDGEIVLNVSFDATGSLLQIGQRFH